MKRLLYFFAAISLVLSCEHKPDIPIIHTGDDPENPGGETPGGGTTPDPSGNDLPGQTGITYQLNVYSFADSNGDGWGDLNGITAHLDYLESLGVSALWLSPVQKSMSYHGYDVTDYSAINPKLGTESDFRNLINKASEKGIDIYMDYVLNHSGSDNPWFQSATSDPDSPYRSYYVFSSNPDTEASAGKIDNYGGGRDNGGMGAWHPFGSGGGKMRFLLDMNNKTVTVTETSSLTPGPNANASVWLYYGDKKMAGFNQKSAGVYELALDFSSSWGFLIRTSTTSWDNGTKYGGDGSALTLGQPYKINNTNPQNIPAPGAMFYFASFNGTMPDLNYGPYSTASSSAAFKALQETASKWIGMGVNGLRLDAVQWIYQNRPAANVSFLKQWYDACNKAYKARGGEGDMYMVGECLSDVNTVTPYFEGLPSMFDFSYWWTLKDRINSGKGNDFAATIAGFRSRFKAKRPAYIDAIKLSNHDEARAAEDLGKDLAKEKLAAAVLLTSPGKPFIYQGEELGYWGNQGGGDEYVRAPIKWTKTGSVPTTALNGKYDKSMLSANISVEAQSADKNSLLSLYRDFAAVRNAHTALLKGEMSVVTSPSAGIAVWKMTSSDETLLVVHNFSASSAKAGSYEIKDTLITNGTVTVSGKEITLGPRASAVFKL